MTSGTWSGDLARAGDEADGLAGADALCNAAASAGGLPGRYDAWLSTNEIDAVDRVQGQGPWNQVGTGHELFSNRSALSGTPQEPAGSARVVDRGAAAGDEQATPEQLHVVHEQYQGVPSVRPLVTVHRNGDRVPAGHAQHRG